MRSARQGTRAPRGRGPIDGAVRRAREALRAVRERSSDGAAGGSRRRLGRRPPPAKPRQP